MLRYVLGNDQFKRMITYYLKKHDYKNVETNDLEVAIHESSGRTLDWFFDQWCYRGGVPAYEVQKQIYTSDNNEYIRFDIKQTHAIEDVVGYFKMPVVFDIYYKDGTKTSETHWVEGAETIIHIKKDKDKDIAFCLFDPNSQIVKTINFKKSTAELLEQLKTAEHMIDRYDALLALKDVKIEEKRETLYRIYDNETFYAMRVEIINQLAKDKDPHSVIVIEKGIEDKQVQVRQAAINVIDEVNAQQKTLLIKMLNDSSYSIIESVLEKLSNIYPNETQQWLEITKNEYGMANALKIKWLYISYLNGNKVALDQLIEYASSNYEFRTRINAMNAIKTLGVVNQSMLKNIFNATLSWNSRLAGPANEALSQLSMNVVNKKAISDFFKTNSWTEKERELIKEKGLKY
jgi:aminopeptidase N